MKMGNAKIVLFVLCLAVCVGMCRPHSSATSPSPSQQSDTTPSFASWAYDKFSHIFGSHKNDEPTLPRTTENLQTGFSTGLGAPVEAPAPGPFASAPQPSSDAAQQAFSYGKDKAYDIKDKAEVAYDDAKHKVESAYQSAKKTVT